MIGLMHHGVLAVEHPMIGVRPLDPHAGFVARAAASETPMAHDVGLDRRDLDLIVFAD
jgi:hypothetical protein